MTAFVWKRVSNLTLNYHDSGGAFAVAETLERARSLIMADNAYKDSRPSGILMAKPDMEYRVADDCPECAVTFPDAGCC